MIVRWNAAKAAVGTAVVPRNPASAVRGHPRQRFRLCSEAGEEMGALSCHEQLEREIEGLLAPIKFRLRGSRRWRHMGEYSTENRIFTWIVHTSDNQIAHLSEGGELPVVVGDVHETPHQKRYNTDRPHLMRQSAPVPF